MTDTTPLTIGADVTCTDGIGGKVSRLVIDPHARTVTHLVVNDRQLQGRLVPVSLVDVDADGGRHGADHLFCGWIDDCDHVGRC